VAAIVVFFSKCLVRDVLIFERSMFDFGFESMQIIKVCLEIIEVHHYNDQFQILPFSNCYEKLSLKG